MLQRRQQHALDSSDFAAAAGFQRLTEALAFSFEVMVEWPLSWPMKDAAEYSRRDIVRWWEARRLRFNFYVGAVGVVSWLLVMIAGSAAVKPGEDFEEPLAMLFGPFLYAFLANICYTLGWITDTLAFQGGPRVGLYKAGVVFSVVLTALPGVWAMVAWLTTVVTGHKLA